MEVVSAGDNVFEPGCGAGNQLADREDVSDSFEGIDSGLKRHSLEAFVPLKSDRQLPLDSQRHDGIDPFVKIRISKSLRGDAKSTDDCGDGSASATHNIRVGQLREGSGEVVCEEDGIRICGNIRIVDRSIEKRS